MTVVGPYAKYDRTLMTECAKTGTHHVDLCGEALFVYDSIANNHEVAQQTGAKVVHSCSFDSILSDVAVHGFHKAAHTKLGETTLLFKHAEGDVFGDTIDSVRVQTKQVKKDPKLRRVIADQHAPAEPGLDQGKSGVDLRPTCLRRH